MRRRRRRRGVKGEKLEESELEESELEESELEENECRKNAKLKRQTRPANHPAIPSNGLIIGRSCL